MIELTEAQSRALEEKKAPLEVVDPRTGEVFVLIRKAVYENVCGVLRPFNRNWDNPEDDDLIRRER
jgi:hypothetical protein